jgi:hypothetical protein
MSAFSIDIEAGPVSEQSIRGDTPGALTFLRLWMPHRSLLMADGRELLLDTFDVDATGHQRDLSPGNAKSVGASAAGRYHPIARPSDRNTSSFLPLKGPCSNNASEKTRDLYPTQPGEQQTDVISEGWNGGVECILLFVRVSSFVTIPRGREPD